MKRERRFIPSGEIRISTNDSGIKTIRGYASVSNQLSEELGGFREKIAPGAFSKCLATNPDVRHLVDHDSSKILGRTAAGTLRLKEDEIGLHFECDLPDTSVGRDIAVSIARKDITQCSFGFVCEEDEWTPDRNTGELIRTVKRASLFDTSCVTFPAYEGTSVSIRSLFPDSKGGMPAEITEKILEIRTKQRAETRYRGVRAAVSSAKWAILPEKLETICALLDARAQGVSATKEEIQAALQTRDSAGSGFENGSSAVAVIPVYGVISQRMSMFDEFSGGTSCEAISLQLKAALADSSVSSIVFDIDSPGGTVTGVPELGAEILAARGQKPIIAVSNGMAASAAYWIASAADKVVVTPSGEVGSIGVYTTHQDVSAAMDKEGVKLTFIKAGKYKTEGNPYEPLSQEAQADIQEGVDKFYGMFTSAVAAGRGVDVEKVLADFGQGRMKMAQDAVAAGMADSVATLDEVIAGLTLVATDPLAGTFSSTSIPEAASASAIAVVDETPCKCECQACVGGNCDDCTDGCDGNGVEEDDELETLKLQLKLRELKTMVSR